MGGQDEGKALRDRAELLSANPAAYIGPPTPEKSSENASQPPLPGPAALVLARGVLNHRPGGDRPSKADRPRSREPLANSLQALASTAPLSPSPHTLLVPELCPNSATRPRIPWIRKALDEMRILRSIRAVGARVTSRPWLEFDLLTSNLGRLPARQSVPRFPRDLYGPRCDNRSPHGTVSTSRGLCRYQCTALSRSLSAGRSDLPAALFYYSTEDVSLPSRKHLPQPTKPSTFTDSRRASDLLWLLSSALIALSLGLMFLIFAFTFRNSCIKRSVS